MLVKKQGYPFSTIIPVRITDINYGNHLGHAATIGIFHQARVLFLNKNGFNELNIDSLGLIMVNISCSFKSEAFFNDQLIVHVGIGNFSKTKFEFLCEAVNQKNDKIVASSREEFAFFDYQNNKVCKMPEKFSLFCEKSTIKEAVETD